MIGLLDRLIALRNECTEISREHGLILLGADGTINVPPEFLYNMPGKAKLHKVAGVSHYHHRLTKAYRGVLFVAVVERLEDYTKLLFEDEACMEANED